MRDKILIGCILCLFSFIPKGAANNYIMNPYTHQEISADSIIERVMTFAPLYETIVSDYRANLYIKGKMDIQKKNFILRYVPSMFRLQKGVREYLLETYSDLHYTAPNIYDQKVKASQGTVRGNRGLPGLLEYFNVNIYSSSLLNDERLLSPLAKNGQKYYKYRIDSVMGDLIIWIIESVLFPVPRAISWWVAIWWSAVTFGVFVKFVFREDRS